MIRFGIHNVHTLINLSLQTLLKGGMASHFEAVRIPSILRVEQLQVLDEGIVTVGVVLDVFAIWSRCSFSTLSFSTAST